MVNAPETIVAPLHEAKPVVLIATDDPASSAGLAEQFLRSGIDARIAVYDGHALWDAPRRAPKAVLIYFKDYLHVAPQVLQTLRERYAAYDLPFIGAFPRKGVIDVDLFDSVIFPPAHPVQIARRVTSMMRLQKMEREILLRINTLNDDFGIGYKFSETALEGPFRVLFVGKASPEFMVIINALENKNVEVIAAFTSFSAFDFLHENPFDAVVMNMLTAPEPALTITQTMRRNSKLYHTPSLLLTGKGFNDHDNAYAKGATDIIPYGADEAEISGRIIEVANYFRIHQRLKGEFGALGGNRCVDEPSGCYNTAFFKAHLRRVFDADMQLREPTSVMMIRFHASSKKTVKKDRLDAAFNQAGRMLKNLVRMEDVVARLSDDTYAVAFPGQPSENVGSAAHRISDVIAASNFQTGDKGYDTFQILTEINLDNAASGESSEALIERLMARAKPLSDIRQTG